MDSIKMRKKVGPDGRLHFDIPTELINQDVDTMVIYQPISSSVQSDINDLDSLYGICADDPILLDTSGISKSLDDALM